jgi:hypothetical protein
MKNRLKQSGRLERSRKEHTTMTNTYSFTHGAVLWPGWATREAAATALYDLQHGRMPDTAHYELPQLALPSPVTIERHWCDEEDHPDAPPEGEEFWTDYESGLVRFGLNEDGSAIDLDICGHTLPTAPVTLATLRQIYIDLGYMLADERVRAALPAGSPLSTDRPPTQMVRVKKFSAACSFPMLVYLEAACAVELDMKEIGIDRKQFYDISHRIAVATERLFDLDPFPIGLDTSKLVDAAYDQGWNEALTTIENYLKLPDDKRARVRKGGSK